MRVATIHRYKGLESPCVVLAEIDERVDPDDLAGFCTWAPPERGRTLSSWRGSD